MNQENAPEIIRERLLDAILPHVVFDGWSDASFRAALRDSGIDPALARVCCPHGAADLVVAFHRRGDRALAEHVARHGAVGKRYRDRIAGLVRKRIELIDDREAARRAAAHFALPHNAPEGVRLIWGTADLIWRLLDDSSDDINWYSKRATLSAVYSTTFLHWIGDESPGNADTWDFLDRRIEEVMRFENLKARLGENALVKPLLAGPLGRMLAQIRAPGERRSEDLPGMWKETEREE